MDSYENRDWNEDVVEDLRPEDIGSLVVFSRDWTVETIFSQISSGNVDLNPKFQRRNAWTDPKRSKLIESLILGVPVPEIVLAEDPKVKKSFIVIDGKQRLLTIAGFLEPEKNPNWDDPKLTLRSSDDSRPNLLNGFTFDGLQDVQGLGDAQRRLLNSDIRCTIIAGYHSDDVLYDIFYRLNTSSVPLSTQELRQVLVKGPFADYLIEITNEKQPIHAVLRSEGPDNRLRDAEMILRYFAIELFGERYRNNLKVFLDNAMRAVTREWESYKPKIEGLYDDYNDSIMSLFELFGEENVGRRLVDGKWQRRFNKVLFEVEVYYLVGMSKAINNKRAQKQFLGRFEKLCANRQFAESIESSTKTNERYEIRFQLFKELIESTFNVNAREVPIKR